MAGRARRASGVLWPLLIRILKLAVTSWRIRVVGRVEELDPEHGSGPVIYSFWHGDLVPCGAALYKRLVARGVPIAALVSRSGDGDLAARAGADFGFSTVRGSSSRGGFMAIRSLYSALRHDRRSVVVVPDGPRGPARTAQAGAAQLAALSGAPIVPMAASVSRAWWARSWDRTVVPWPFARIDVTVGERLTVSRSATAEQGAAELTRVLSTLAPAERA